MIKLTIFAEKGESILMKSGLDWKKAIAIACSVAFMGTTLSGFAPVVYGDTESAEQSTTKKPDGDNYGDDIFTTKEADQQTTSEDVSDAESTNEETQESIAEPTSNQEVSQPEKSEQESAVPTLGQTESDLTTNGQAALETTTLYNVTTTLSTDTSVSGKSKIAAPVIKKAVKKKSAKKLVVKVKRVSGAAGYQVKVSTNKKFKKKKTKTANSKKINITVKKLKAKKKYYVKARAYTIKDGKKSYGKWSKIKKVKMK